MQLRGLSQSPHAVPVAIRLSFSAVFLYSAATKLIGFDAAVTEMAGLGLPFPSLAAAGTIIVQLVGGLAVAAGLFVFPAAIALAVFTFAATLIGHPFWTFDGPEFTRQLTTTLEHVAIMGGLVLLAYDHTARRRQVRT
ncbi:DoxX family protein [Sulfitobacter sp. D35]|uniref:DoxX family protein n=1 Tax=Sulfitobacter sp. D35 TaxID=3083252 RepID=UPI00296E4308|nr:DoxX family protein [Sulfitobacter sp. D35]MDW4497873.1 DoxX family protein [Sulfitobacter sp. D35]